MLEKINHAFQGEHELHALIRRQFRPVFYTLAAIELGCMEPKDAVQRARLSPDSAAGKNRPLRAENSETSPDRFIGDEGEIGLLRFAHAAT